MLRHPTALSAQYFVHAVIGAYHDQGIWREVSWGTTCECVRDFSAKCPYGFLEEDGPEGGTSRCVPDVLEYGDGVCSAYVRLTCAQS